MAIQESDVQNKQIVNPFANIKNADLNLGTVEIESARARAEVEARVLMARRFPRDPYKASERILAACARPAFAESALYAYPRGGKTVTGLSIRAAEEILLEWGNVEYGMKEIGYYGNETEIEAYCWDLETNARSPITFRVPRERWKKGGSEVLIDPRDIYENNANNGARRMRSRMLAIIPADLKDAVEAACRATIAGNGDEPILKKINKMVDLFNKLGVTVNHIQTRLKHKLEDILPDEYAEMVAIYNSLKDGQSVASDWFAMPKTALQTEAAQDVDSLLTSKPEPVKTEPEPATDEPIELIDELKDKVNAKLQKLPAALRNPFRVNAVGDIPVDQMNADQLLIFSEALDAEINKPKGSKE